MGIDQIAGVLAVVAVFAAVMALAVVSFIRPRGRRILEWCDQRSIRRRPPDGRSVSRSLASPALDRLDNIPGSRADRLLSDLQRQYRRPRR